MLSTRPPLPDLLITAGVHQQQGGYLQDPSTIAVRAHFVGVPALVRQVVHVQRRTPRWQGGSSRVSLHPPSFSAGHRCDSPGAGDLRSRAGQG